MDTHFARAIRKYGKEHFHISLLDTASSQEELNEKERKWIIALDSVNSGYNETDAIYKCGGNTYMSKSQQEMQNIKEKLSDSKRGSLNPHATAVKCYNIKTDEELFFDTVDDCRKYFNEKTHRFITTRVSLRTRSYYKGEWKIGCIGNDYPEFELHPNKRGNTVSVMNIDTGEKYQYESIRLAERTYGLKYGSIKKYTSNDILLDGKYKFIISN